MNGQPISRARFAAILLCFFLSGAAGLIYQVAWSKALGLVFGHTVYAVATVIAVFMGGLALGSAWLGRWSERRANAVALYGWVEIVIGLAGALSLVGLAGVRALYVAAYPAFAGSAVALLALRFAASVVVLFIPTFLMGGTLPILVKGLTRSSAELGARISRLYWVNTSGAVAGTIAAGFLLVPWLGLRLTVAVAVMMNLLAGAVALALSRKMQAAETPQRESADDASAPRPWFLLVSFAVVGATAIVYEVAWTRVLATQLGSSTYAFTVMLGTFLAGIVLGSALFERMFRGGREVQLGAFSLTQTLTGLAAVGFLVAFQKMPVLVALVLKATHQAFWGLVLAQCLTCALAMLPAAIVFGFNFPVVTVLIAGRPEESGHYAAAVGRAYAANTLGAIAGATAAGFWLVPRLGAFRMVALTAAANLLLAVLLELRRQPRRALALALNSVLLGVVATAGWRNTFYDSALANFNTILYWNQYEGSLSVEESANTVDYVFTEEGLNATITVARSDGYVSLRTNGKVDASTGDTLTQLMVGHLGGIFHPAPRRVLVIGFGSGMTVSSIALYPEVERIDCVEIEPAVIHAAPYLESLNRGVLRDPRVHVILDDARNYLLTTRQQYDLIISEPSNPWIAGVATLFTDEFYREVRARLAPGGIFLQWVQAYSVFPDDVRMMLATLAPHFPQLSAWRGEDYDVLVLAQTVPGELRLDRLRKLWDLPALRRDYDRLEIRRPEGLAAYHLLDDADLRRLAAGARRNTDDKTRLEYTAPRSLLVPEMGSRNLQVIMKARSDLLPRILRIDDQNELLLGIAETLVGIEDFTRAGDYLVAIPDASTSAAVEIVRGRWQLATNHFDDAARAYAAALRMDPSSVAAKFGVAEVARRRGNADEAERLFTQILEKNAAHLPTLYSLTRIAQSRQDWPAAIRWQRAYIAADPSPKAEDYALLGEFLMSIKQDDEAQKMLEYALTLDPYQIDAHRSLGLIFRRAGRWNEALPHLELAARLSPSLDSRIYLALADTYRGLQQPNAARAVLRKALRFFPNDRQISLQLGP